MQYALLIYETPGEFARRQGEDAQAYWSSWSAYFDALGARAASGACLKTPDTGTVMRRGNGARKVEDGPHADSKEQLGGFTIIEADSLDEALAWAERCPAAATGAVEVRPVMAMADVPEMQS